MPQSSAHGAASLYGRLVATRPQGASKYRSMRQDLAFFGAADLYGYACPAGVRDPRQAGNAALVARAEQRVADYPRNTSERSAAERLCSRAREVFADDAERRRYDEYLQWCDLRAVFDDLDARLGPEASSCGPDDVAQELARLNELLGSRSQADALMESFLANRGVSYGAAAVRPGSDELAELIVGNRAVAPVAVLPDSALMPSTPDPGAVAQAQQRAVPAPAPVPLAQAGAGFVRKCGACGALNEAGMRFCCSCGAPMSAPAAAPAQLRRPVRPAGAVERKFPLAAVVALVVVALAVAGAAVYVALNGVPFAGGDRAARESAAPAADPGTKRVPSGSVNAVPCSAKTRIVPLGPDEQPLQKYTVELKRKGSGSAVDTTLSISGTGGFTLADFNDPGKSAADVSDGTFEVVMTDAQSAAVCTVTVEYHEGGSSTTSTLEVVAAP